MEISSAFAFQGHMFCSNCAKELVNTPVNLGQYYLVCPRCNRYYLVGSNAGTDSSTTEVTRGD